jgi:NAD(P)-dependent dehydrogenase (short-subunit alcohol dehydrogenase family)
MDPIRFDGRVAIVTGAGRGIGKAHAQLLAERGARLVVNDLGGTRAGDGSDPDVAGIVAAELRAAGGDAVADASDIASVQGAAELVSHAVGAYGQVDILVNNAGIFTPDEFPALEFLEFRRYFDIHVGGSFNVTRECWPYMAKAGYGRVVMTTSHGILGAPFLTSYGTAKGGVFALARGLATLGRDAGIKVNSIAPVAATRLTRGPTDSSEGGIADENAPALVSPLVALLCHETCAVTGETFVSGGRRQARLFLAETEGYVHPDVGLTPEAVASHWAQIMDESAHYLPPDTATWVDMNDARIAVVPVSA